MLCVSQDVIRSLYCDFKPRQNIFTNFKFLDMNVRFVSFSLYLPQTLQKTKTRLCTNNLRSLSFDVHRSMHRNILRYNQQDAPLSQNIYSRKTLYMFRTVFPSTIRSSKLHIRQQACVKQLLLPAAS